MQKKYLIFIGIVAAASYGIMNLSFKPVNPYYDNSILVIDKNRDKMVNIIEPFETKAWFDFNGDTFANSTSWIKEDYILVYDLNHDGVIFYGKEFFYDEKLSKLDMLNKLDINDDQILNHKDKEFKYLKLFNDKNSNGSIDKNEIVAFDKLDKSILIDLDNKFLHVNNKNYMLQEVKLTASRQLTNYVKADELKKQLTAKMLFLPFIRGYGRVHDTQNKYILNPAFKEYVEKLSKEDPANIEKEFPTFMKKWIGLDEVHKKYGINRIETTYDDKTWMIETISGYKENIKEIEAAYAKGSSSSIQYNTKYIDTFYKSGYFNTLSRFLFQTTYRNILKGAYYKLGSDTIGISNRELADSSIIEYVNSLNSNEDIERLARTLAYLNIKQKYFQNKLLKKINSANKEKFIRTYKSYVDEIMNSKFYATAKNKIK